MQIYLNGALVPKEQATISVFDHGLLYGDGVFEGIRSYADACSCCATTSAPVRLRQRRST